MALAQSVSGVPAPPPLPSSFYGTVKQDNANIAAATPISAWVGSTKVSETTAFLTGPDSVYRIDVPGDDPGTPAIEGGRDHQPVVFQVGSTRVQMADWQSGTYVRLDLTVAPDADGDGWSLGLDCNDADATVNSGRNEVIGNLKDDDCNPATPDAGSPPTASFSLGTTLGLTGVPVSFVDASSDPDGPLAAWAWDFQSDGSVDSAATSPSFTYTTPGTYSIRLTVTDGQGMSATATRTLKVTQRPQAAFTVTPTQVRTNLQLSSPTPPATATGTQPASMPIVLILFSVSDVAVRLPVPRQTNPSGTR